MTVSNNIPGKGLLWPESIRAVVKAYGDYPSAARAIGVSKSAVGKWVRGSRLPEQRATLDALFRFWGSGDELPQLDTPPPTRPQRRMLAQVPEVAPLVYAEAMPLVSAGKYHGPRIGRESQTVLAEKAKRIEKYAAMVAAGLPIEFDDIANEGERIGD